MIYHLNLCPVELEEIRVGLGLGVTAELAGDESLDADLRRGIDDVLLSGESRARSDRANDGVLSRETLL